MIKKFDEFLNESNNERDFSSYGWYDMSNALDIEKAVLPELKNNNIQFKYDRYSNHLEIEVEEEQSKIANKILTEIGDGTKSDHDMEENDSALILPMKMY